MGLTAASAATAASELNEPDATEAAVSLTALRTRVTEAHGTEEAARWEWALLATLRQCKWDLEKASKKVAALSNFAAKKPELFEAATPQEFLAQASIGVISHLPTRNSRGQLVMLLNGQAMTELAKRHTMTDMLRFSVFYMTYVMADEETQVNGAIIVENLHNYPMMALNRMSGLGPSGMKASFDWMNVSPLRLRGIFGCKQPWYVGLMLALVRPFMSKKMKDRVALFGSDTDAMLAAAGLRPEQVPTMYGGTIEDFDPAWHLKNIDRM